MLENTEIALKMKIFWFTEHTLPFNAPATVESKWKYFFSDCGSYPNQ